MRSDDKPQLSTGQLSIRGRRHLAAGLAGLIAVPVLLLAACGNADRKVANDPRPDPRASTAGAQSAYPQPIESGSVVKSTPLSGTEQQQAPVDPDPINAIPPEDLVSQAGIGERQGDN